ncbi:MAG: hypothetical protein ACOH2N_05300 [Devosia sp.]
MASSVAISPAVQSGLDANRRDGFGMVLSGALPLCVFIIANGLAELVGVLPLFFAPFGLPGWIGAALHLGSLPLFGVARWMVVECGRDGRRAGWWLVGLMAGSIALPFMAPQLDQLLLSVTTVALFLVGLAAAARVAKLSALAALLMAPGLVWMGLSGFVGMSLVAAWAPPFGLTNGQGQAAH